jgi:hypothetical protein
LHQGAVLRPLLVLLVEVRCPRESPYYDLCSEKEQMLLPPQLLLVVLQLQLQRTLQMLWMLLELQGLVQGLVLPLLQQFLRCFYSYCRAHCFAIRLLSQGRACWCAAA